MSEATSSRTSRLLAWFKGEEPGAEPQQAKRRRHRPNHNRSGADDASNHGKVRFQSDPPRVKTIISLNHYTEEEFKATFWAQPEFLKILERADSLLEQIEAGKMDPKKVCVRGLEKMMGDLRKHVKKARQDTVDGVMDTQEQQWQSGRDDVDEIRKASFQVTQHSQQRALELARQDFLSSRRYLKDLIDQTTENAGQRMPLGYSFNPHTDTICSMPLASILKKPKKSNTRSRSRRSQSPKRTMSKSPLRLKLFGGKDTSDLSSPSTATTATSSTDSEPRSGSAFESARRTMERVFPSMVSTPSFGSKPLTPPPLVRETSNSSASSNYSERSLRRNATPKRSTSETLTPSRMKKTVGSLPRPARHGSPLSKSDRTDTSSARSSRDAVLSRRNLSEHSDGPRARPAPQTRRPPGRSASEHVRSSNSGGAGPPSKQQLLQQKQRMRRPPARSASEQVPRGDRPAVPASGRRLNSESGSLHGSIRGSRPSRQTSSGMDRSKSPKRVPPRRTASEHGPPRRQPSSSNHHHQQQQPQPTSRKDLVQQSLSQQQQQLVLPSKSNRKIRRQTSKSEHTHGTAPLSDDSFLGLDSFHEETSSDEVSTRSARSSRSKPAASSRSTTAAHDHNNGQMVENIRGTMTLTLE